MIQTRGKKNQAREWERKQLPPWDGDRLGEVLRGSQTPLANRTLQFSPERYRSVRVRGWITVFLRKMVTLIAGRDERVRKGGCSGKFVERLDWGSRECSVRRRPRAEGWRGGVQRLGGSEIGFRKKGTVGGLKVQFWLRLSSFQSC